MSKKVIPDHFKPIISMTGYSKSLEPFYLSYRDNKLVMGILIGEHHLNNMGTAHGGLYMTFMDMALSTEVCCSLNSFAGISTIGFTMDFMASAEPGDFIWADTQVLKTTRTLAFTQGVVRCGDDVLSRVNATFKLPNTLREADGKPADFFYEWATGLPVPQD
ncbi:MAG: PaaI family thioesterase [Pseudomonadota bacterium]